MSARRPAAPHFYSGDCARATDRFLQGFIAPAEPAHIVAGVVPHAGWVYSGAVAAKVFESIRQKEQPETFVFFGTVHRWTGETAVYARGAWATPLGDIAVDETLAAEILDATHGLASENPAAHKGEHAIEVQLPFVKYLFPQAKIVPISVGPDENAVPLGQRVGEVLATYSPACVIIGSTDLTHYGDVYHFIPAGYGNRAYQWLRGNDANLLALAEQMRATEIVPEANRHHNACGPGALAATVSAAATVGAQRGYLVDYTTSYDVEPEPEFRIGVGYAGIVY
jgi:MEMO1 family protein